MIFRQVQCSVCGATQHPKRKWIMTISLLRSRFTRLSGWQVAAVMMLLALTACSDVSAPSLTSSTAVALSNFPDGIGRGYPTARLLDDSNKRGGIQAGASAPDFAIVLDNGNHLRLSDLQGRPVVINFWATWCGPCRMEMPELMRAAAANPNLAILAVNVREAQAVVTPFAEEFAMRTPVVIDPEGVVQTLYEVRGLPTTIFIDKHGRIDAIYAGALTPATLEERLAAIR
jgi:thiol-disulfide isomerase/thioredoxin